MPSNGVRVFAAAPLRTSASGLLRLGLAADDDDRRRGDLGRPAEGLGERVGVDEVVGDGLGTHGHGRQCGDDGGGGKSCGAQQAGGRPVDAGARRPGGAGGSEILRTHGENSFRGRFHREKV